MKYVKLSEYNIKKILALFCVDIVATKAAILLGFNRKTIDTYYYYFRMQIAANMLEFFKPFDDQVEIDILYRCNYNGEIIVGMAGKNANIVVVKIEQNNFVTIDIIKRYVVSGSTLFTAKGICEDNFSCYGYKHCEIGNKETELLFHKKCMLNTIHSFSSYSKRRMIQFSGSGCRDCFLYFNECAFRFTHRNVSMYDAMLPILKINSRYSVLATKTRKQNRRRTSGPDLPIISC